MNQKHASELAGIDEASIQRWCENGIIRCDFRAGRKGKPVVIPDSEALVLNVLRANKDMVRSLSGLRRLADETRRAGQGQ